MAHGVVRTDNMAATDVRGGENLVSVRFKESGAVADIDNGRVVLLNGLEAGEREVYEAVAPAASSPIEDVVLVASPEVMYSELLRNLDDFYNEKGKAARAYHFHRNDTFGVTADCLDAAADIAVGNVVELQASTKMKVVASSSGATQVGTVIAIEPAGRHTYVVIKVD